MRLEESFETFLTEEVGLDNTRTERVISAHNTVRDRLKTIDDVRERMKGEGSYLQGSYALHTAVRPSGGDAEYDVDVVLTLNEFWTPQSGAEILQWLQDHLESIGAYNGKTQILKHCVRVQYEADDQRFHLDVVPAHVPHSVEDPILIPPKWKQSHPKGFIAWLNQRKKQRCDRVKHIVRLLKYWRNLNDGEGSGPNSMILTTLVGQYAPKDYRSLDDALVKTMESINRWLGEQTVEIGIEVSNPSLPEPEENLARNWDWESFRRFRDRFSRATSLAREALDCTNEEKTIELWNQPELFDGRFPKTVRGLGDESKRIATALEKGTLGVGVSGRIDSENPSSRLDVPNNRGFYGHS